MPHEDQFDREAWRELRKATRRQPLFIYARVHTLPGGVVVERGWLGVLGPVLLMILGAAFLLAAREAAGIAWGAGTFSASAAVTSLIGVAMMFLAVEVLASPPRLWWGHDGEDLCIRHGWYPYRKTLRISRGMVECRMMLVEAEDVGSALLPRQSMVVLRRRDTSGEDARLAVGPRADVEGLFDALEEFLDGQGVDETVEPLQLAGGAVVTVPRSPLSRLHASFQTMRLVQRSEDLAIVRPTAAVKVICLCLLVVGVLVLRQLPVVIFEQRWLGVGLIALVGGIFALCGLIGVIGGQDDGSVTVDGQRKMLLVRPGIPGLGRRQEIPFDHVAALQICSQPVSGDDGSPSRTLFELNLVLSQPPGQRIHIMRHLAAEQARADAQVLAQMLDVGIVDHG